MFQLVLINKKNHITIGMLAMRLWGDCSYFRHCNITHGLKTSNPTTCRPGRVTGGEGDCVPAESGSGEVSRGRPNVFPASSERELQTAVERWSSSWLLHH